VIVPSFTPFLKGQPRFESDVFVHPQHVVLGTKVFHDWILPFVISLSYSS
jgi:hypothetical protein